MDITFYFITTFLVVVIELSFAVVMILDGKRPLTRTLAAFLFLHTVWLSAEAIFHQTTNPELANILIIFFHYFGGIISSAFFYLILVYSNEVKTIYTIGDSLLKKRTALILTLFNIVLLPLYASGLIVGNTFLVATPELWGWKWGPLWFISPAVFVLFFGAGLFKIYKKYQNSNGKTRRNLSVVFWGILVSMLPVFILSVFLPSFFNFFNFSWVGPLTTLALIFMLMFAVVELYGIVISSMVTKIIIFASTAILFVNIFIRDTATSGSSFFSPEGVLRAAVFISFFFVGYIIVSNILRETEQKEKIEKVNKELGAVNAELEKKVLERELGLNISKKHIEAILENITLGIIEYSSSFSIIQLNEAAERLLGINKEDVVGKIISGVEQTGILSSFSKVIHDGKTNAVSKEDLRGITYSEINLEYPKRRELQVATIPIRMGSSVKVSGFIKLLRDITRERDIDRDKSNFIAIVAHQLGAPLEAIEWSLGKLLSDKKLERPREMLDRIRYSNENLIQITTDLLNASRIDNGEFTMKFEPYDIGSVLLALINHFKGSAEKKNISLVLQNKGESIPRFLFDPDKIKLAIKNIIHNAIDYTPVNGSVTVTLKGDIPGYAVVTIQDSGIGIPREEAERLFTKFYRSKKALLMETDRSGLGLYITKYIIDCHKGTIRVDSSEGMGANVEIKIPLNTEPQS